MHAYLEQSHLASARTSVGLSALPGGAAYYDFLIRSNTTTTLSAADVHRLGLAEVDRITAGMAEVQRKVGFEGTLAEFFQHLRTDTRFAAASAQELAERYADIGRRVWGMETLYLHEATPGHHMQVSLAAEATVLPKLLRFGGNTAYIEGWALYAESLGFELGLFQDPYPLFGHYNDEMLRAMRLVVDAGLHAQGWSRERAIAYMLAHSAMSVTDATAEVERYIADPGQALAYKVGALTIQRLRKQAEPTLGARFDIRAFHRQVLETGSVPMAVLEAKIEAWTAAR